MRWRHTIATPAAGARVRLETQLLECFNKWKKRFRENHHRLVFKLWNVEIVPGVTGGERSPDLRLCGLLLVFVYFHQCEVLVDVLSSRRCCRAQALTRRHLSPGLHKQQPSPFCRDRKRKSLETTIHHPIALCLGSGYSAFRTTEPAHWSHGRRWCVYSCVAHSGTYWFDVDTRISSDGESEVQMPIIRDSWIISVWSGKW